MRFTRKTLMTCAVLLMIGLGACSNNNSDGSSEPVNTDTGSITNSDTIVTAVDGYIKNAAVRDALGARATYSSNGKYIFPSSPVYPITLSGGVIDKTGVMFDINMSVSDGSSLLLSPITTFLGNDSALLATFSNLDLNRSTFEDFSIDYVATDNTSLAKLSQILYVILRDANLTAIFKQTLLSTTPTTLNDVFTLAEADINASKTIGTEERVQSRALLNKVETYTGNTTTLESFIEVEKEHLAFLTVHRNPFVTVWKTTQADTDITIPTDSSYSYDYIVDWGDGIVEHGITGNKTHIYSNDGNHTVKIYDTFPAIKFNNLGDKDKLLLITSWGDLVWKSMESAFYGCSNVRLITSDTPDLSKVTSLSGMFANTESFNADINNWDVSNINNMNGTFSGAIAFNQPLNNWDMSHVRYLSNMFNGASKFDQDISSWNVSHVTGMSQMFLNATDFNHDIGDWNVSNVTNMGSLFMHATNFNQNISNWNVSHVIGMPQMFLDATNFNQAIGNWDMSNVTYTRSMFLNATNFNQNISNWDVSHVIDMSQMFLNATNFNQDIRDWNVSNVTNMRIMFQSASSFSNHDLSTWDVGNVTDHTDFMTNAGSGNTEPTWP